jgi:WD40 repeat protein
LVASVDTGDIQVWDFKGNHRPRTLRGHMSRARIARWSPDGTRIASGAYDNTIRIWDAVSGVELLAIPTASPPEHTLAWNADGTRVAARDTTTTIGIWDAASGEKVQTLAGHASQLISLGWDPVTHRIATGCAAGNIKIWDALSGEQLEELPGHQDTVRFLAWGPDGVTLASASHDRSVKLWDVPSDLPGELLHVHDGPVRALFWQHDGRELASADVDGVVRIWERALGNVTTASHAPLDAKGILAWSASAERWALVNEDNEVDIVEESTGTKARTLQCGADSIRSVAWSPSGRDIAVATHRQVDIWQLASGKKMRTLPLPVRAKHNIPELCWCPDESRLVISEGNALRIVRVDSGEIVHRTYLPPFLEYGCACWSQDARMLAIGVVDGSIEVWDAEDWRRVNVLRGHVGRISCLSWSPDRRRLASAGSDAVVRLWDVDLGREICTLNRHEGLHRCVAWSRDGHQLATGGDDGTICVYDASKGYEVADAPQLRVASAEWLAGMGDLEQALETVCDLVETYPDTQAYRTLLSEIMQKHALAGMTEEEMPENLRLLLKKHLVTVECQTATCSHFVRLAKRHIGRNEFREATADYDQAIELSDRTSSIAEIYKARAFAHFYLEHFDQALADLRKSIEYRPTDIGILTRAISPREIGACPDESFREGLIELAGDVVKLNAFSARAYVVRGLILAACGKEEDALADLRAALQSLPDENSKGSFDLRKTSREFRQLCDALAHREEGFTGLVRMRGLQPREVVPWCYGALAQCCVPRANEYQAICRGMIEQFREDESPNTGYWVAWTCVLRPEAVDNYEPVIRLAEQAVEADPESETYLDTLGVVLYRAGRAEEAVERLTEANKRFEAHDSESTSSPAYTWYFLAMAHQKAGHVEQAREYLNKANQRTDEESADKEKPPPWNRRATLELLRKEAEALLATDDPKSAKDDQKSEGEEK